MSPVVIGLSGHMGAGKDTIADYLVRTRGFTVVRISDALREEVLATLPRTLRAVARVEFPTPDDDEAFVRYMVYTLKPPIIRCLLQEWGTDLRRAERENYWVQKWHERCVGLDRVVVPDVRFPDELRAVRSVGGHVAYVYRPGHRGDTHASERAFDGEPPSSFTQHFTNVGTVSDLEAQVEEWLVGLGLSRTA
jgi:hypothetical protein